jgi:ubiquinone/menaquinone biosynthesis C-methylase UbiE
MAIGTQYDYDTRRSVASARNIGEAIEVSVMNYMHDQLGWSADACRQRAEEEARRTRQQGILADLERRGWEWAARKVLDVGAGQGGMLLELLERGADAYAVEPGREFVALTGLRLADARFTPHRVSRAHGERLPFSDGYFDYAIALQVLEHVPRPKTVLEEIYRVLKPGGHCYVSTENYWSFHEPHYRVYWFPMLPKRIGSLYLSRLGRDPDFLRRYIYYTSYAQIWLLCRRIGFLNVTYQPLLDKVQHPATIARRCVRVGAKLLSFLPAGLAKSMVYGAEHLTHCMRPGAQMVLTKPV